MNEYSPIRRFALICSIALFPLVLVLRAANSQTTGYAIGEPAAANGAIIEKSVPPSDSSVSGPVRLGRFSYLQGDVTWRPEGSQDWSSASINQPLKQGAQIAVAPGGRAEVQFDDGSYLRLGSGATIVFQVLFSDAEGEFTQISLTSGLASLRVRHDRSVYQVDTPLVSVKAGGPARIRIGINDGVEVSVRQGSSVVEGSKGKVTMKVGDYLDLRDASTPYIMHDLPVADSWETWNDARDQMLDAAEQSLERHDVPANVALVAGNLDAYGTWRTDADYGQVWSPRTPNTSWRPYYAGHWVWLHPVGWTWCSDEPWGWAPYHYGTWFHSIHGWAWKPGPANQYWCPAVVHFTELNGNIAWCALAPSEIQYPATIAVGVFGKNWPGYFSIGAAGGYYSVGAARCVGRAFSAALMNGSATGTRGEPALLRNGTSLFNAQPFVPVNSKAAAGVSTSSQAGFAGRGPFTQLIAGSTTVFTQGHVAAVPAAGSAPVLGPTGVKPSSAQLTALNANVRSAADLSHIAALPVFHSPVPKEPVQAVTNSALAAVRAGGPISVISGRNTGGAADAAAAARTTLNGGRTNGSGSTAGPAATAGYTSGRVTTTNSNTGGSTAGGATQTSGTVVPHNTPSVSPSPAPASGGGSSPSSGGGNSAGHPSGGSTPTGPSAGGGSHAGGGQTGGSSPVRH